MTEENKQIKGVVVSKKVRDIIKCSNCKRHRSMFVNANLNHNLKETLVEVKENGEYTRGGTPLSDEDPCRFKFFVHRKSAFYKSIEVSYYSAKRVRLSSVCFY